MHSAFNPTTWEVYEPFTAIEFDDSVSLTTYSAPDEQLYAKRKPVQVEIPDRVKARAADILRTREHEWTHFRQHISTPLGTFIHRLCGAREFFATSYFKHQTEAVSERRRPFRELLQSDPSGYLRLWHVVDLLESILWC